MVWLETKRGDWVNMTTSVSLDRLFVESDMSVGEKSWHILLQLNNNFKIIIEGGIKNEEDAKEIQDKIMNRIRSGMTVIYKNDYIYEGESMQ